MLTCWWTTRVKKFRVQLFLFWENAETYSASTFDPDRSLSRTAYNVKESHRGVPWGSVTSVPKWQGLEEESYFESVTYGIWRKNKSINKLDIAQESWNSRKDELCGCHWTSLLSCRRQPWSGKRWTWRQLLTMKWQSCGKKLRTFGIRWKCRLKRCWLFSVAKSW